MKKIYKVLTIVGLVAASSAVMADNNYDMGAYINASVGGGILHIPSIDFGFFETPSENIGLIQGPCGCRLLICI